MINNISQKYSLFFSVFCCIVVILTFGSCSSKKFLGEGEQLIRASEIVVEGSEKDNYLTSLKNEMKNIPHPRPNSRILWLLPRERSYLRIQQKEDTTGWNRFILRNFAERPSLNDSVAISNTASAFERYFRGKGFYNARVDYDVRVKKHRAFVKYKVQPGRLFQADSLQIITPDQEVKRILAENHSDSRFQRGAPLSRENYDAEVRRITRLLRNSGYYEFYPNYISTLRLVDTTESYIAVKLEISPPLPDSIHRKYTLRDISIFPDHDPFTRTEPEIHFKEDSINYFFRQDPQIKISRIRNNLFFQRGDYYNMDAYNRTIRQLGNLSIFRFPSIIIHPDTSGGYFLDYDILLRPNKKFENSTNLELSFSRIQNITSLLGFTFSHSLENRNVFGGSERLIIDFEAGIETALRSLSTGNTYNLRLGGDLTSPQFRDYTGMLSIANRLRIGDRKLLGDDFFQQMRTEANINLNANIGISQYQQFYSYVFMNTSYGTSIQRSPTRFYDIRLLGINYWSPRELSDFDELIQEDILFRRRFNKRLITGFLFKELFYRFESRPNRFGESYSVLANFELSGHEIGLINSVSRLVSGKKLIDELTLGRDTISFAKFVRFDFDGRYHKSYSPSRKLALRAFAGAAIPLSRSGDIPYIKQYFGGGAYGVRAWQLRELGPGGLIDTIARDRNILFYQSGDIRLEFNAEYRFDLIWALEGAAFVDIGNVWNISSGADPVTRFTEHFYRQLAVGAGLGLRFNFDFFIARFDFAYKVKNPYKDPKTGSYWAIREWSDLRLSNMALNFAIGYPF